MVCHQLLILQGMLSPNGNNGFKGAQSPVCALASGLPPGHLLLQDMEQRDHVSETTVESSVYESRSHAGTGVDPPLKVYIAIGDRDHDNLELLGRCAESQEQGYDVVDS